MNRKPLTILITMIALQFSLAMAEVPQLVTYQGRLLDTGGSPVPDGTYQLLFQIYDDPAAGAIKWSSGARQVTVTDGLFTYNLGDTTAIPDDLFENDSALWLGVTVGADPEISPRTRLTSYGYAYQALRADTADFALALVGGGGTYLPLSGGSMTGPITNTGDPAITMGKGNFGTNNTNAGISAFVAGEDNIAEGDWSSVGGGRYNFARGNYSVIGGGGNVNLSDSNSASGQNTVIGGGRQNKANADIATVGGGGSNEASGAASTIAGGAANIASGTRSTVAGGGFNFARGNYSTIGGGGGGTIADSNSISGLISTIAGGYRNTINGDVSTVGGGGTNTITGGSNTIGGGGLNSILATSATIGGGANNSITSNSATISGGINHTASGVTSVVGGGHTNTASNEAATVGGGNSNTASGYMATVPGGRANTASGAYSIASGFAAVASGDFATVAGGQFNISDDTASTVGGGRYNRARGWFSTVAGGGGPNEIDSNSASGDWSTVAGGRGNRAGGIQSFVGGGYGNYATAQYSTNSGGAFNFALGLASTVGGGGNDSALGLYSTVPGGRLNTATGDYSFAAGRQAKANHSGAFVWADNQAVDFASTNLNQFLIRASGGVGIGTNNPSGVLEVANSNWSSGPLRISGVAGISVGPTLEMDATNGTAGNSYSIISTSTGAAAGGGKLGIYHNGPTNAGYRWVIDSTGNIGIGTSFPSNHLDVEAFASVVADFNRTSNDGVIINLQQNGTTEGTISVSGTTVSYNAFTGSHYGWTHDVLHKGELVTLTGDNQYFHDNPNSEIIYGIEKSSIENDPACLGSYLALSEPNQPYSSENPNLVMAVGNGEMWVVDDGHNIQAGDYLISSSTPGHAMKDDEERFSIGHVVARAAEDVNWSTVVESIGGKKHKKISVLFGNFVRTNASVLNRKIAEQQNQIESLEDRLTLLEASLSKQRAQK